MRNGLRGCGSICYRKSTLASDAMSYFTQWRGRVFLLVAALSLMAPLLPMYWPAGQGLDATGHPIGRDFINVWAGPQVAFRGKVEALFDIRAYRESIDALFARSLPFHYWSYPLYTLFAFWPLAQLPYFWALAAWTLGLLVVFSAVVVREVEPSCRLPALTLLTTAPACLLNVIGGQNGFLSAALFLSGIRCIDGRPVVAGVLFGLLSFKPHLGVVLPFALLALRAWRVIASAVVTSLTLFATSVAVFGWGAWANYFTATSAIQFSLLEHFKGFYTSMMVSVLACLRAGGVPYEKAMFLQAVFSVGAIAGAVWAVRHARDSCQRAFILITATLLATPYAFNYDMTALAAVLVWLMVGRLQAKSMAGIMYISAWLAPPAVMILTLFGVGVAPFVTLFYLVALFGLAMHDSLSTSSAVKENQVARLL
jgi:hypothetical protein